MKKVPTDEVQPGMKIARKVENEGGMVLLPEGIELTEGHIGRLKKWGIKEVYIEGEDGGGGNEIVEDLAISDEFLSRLEHKFELVKDDPIMQGIYNAVKSVAQGSSGA